MVNVEWRKETVEHTNEMFAGNNTTKHNTLHLILIHIIIIYTVCTLCNDMKRCCMFSVVDVAVALTCIAVCLCARAIRINEENTILT